MARNPLQIGDGGGNALSLAPWQVGDPTDPMAVANAQTGAAADPLAQWLAAQRAKSEARTTPFWNPNNPVGTETTRPQQSMSMPDPSFRPGVFAGGGTVPMSAEQIDAFRRGSEDVYDQASNMLGAGPAGVGRGTVALASRRPLANPPPPSSRKMGAGMELDPYDLKAPTHLTPGQQAAVEHYANGSMFMNGDSPEAEALRGHMDAAIESSKLSSNARLYRGFALPMEQIEKIKPGDVVPFSGGYVSTTTDKNMARNFADDVIRGEGSVLAELRVPKGHPALHVPTLPDIAEQFFGNQNEVVLPRSTRFRIHSINEKSEGRYDILAEPVPP